MPSSLAGQRTHISIAVVRRKRDLRHLVTANVIQIIRNDTAVIHVQRGVTPMSAKTLNVRLPEALYDQIEELAKSTERTKSFLTIDALTTYVERQAWQVRDIREGIREADAGEFATDDQVQAVFAKYGA